MKGALQLSLLTSIAPPTPATPIAPTPRALSPRMGPTTLSAPKLERVTAATPAPIIEFGSTPLQLFGQFATAPLLSIHWFTLFAIPSTGWNSSHLSSTNL